MLSMDLVFQVQKIVKDQGCSNGLSMLLLGRGHDSSSHPHPLPLEYLLFIIACTKKKYENVCKQN